MESTAGTYFGIDFGTTCSAVSSYTAAGTQGRLAHYAEKAGRPMPSAAAVNTETGELIIGHAAWAKQSELSSSHVYVPSIKRRLGTDWAVETAQGPLSATDIASNLFRALRSLAKKRSGLSLCEAVVAIPVGFDGIRRQALRQAAQEAGIRIAAFVSEPTAAFFANYKRLRNAHYIAVFDWGGGTLDVSVLRHENGAVYEEAAVGLEQAGNDIDELLARHVHSKICRRLGAHTSFEEMEPRARDLLRVRCEEAKRVLSDADHASVQLNRYGDLGPCRVSVEYSLFSDLVAPMVKNAVHCLEKAVSEAGLETRAIDRVLMTGGTSNLRPVQERLRQDLDARLFFPGETVWNVADGASAVAASPGRYRSNQRIGIRLSDGSLFGLLHEGDALDGWQQSHTFGLVDGTEQARIVFGGSPDIENDELSRITLSFPAYNFMQEMLRLDAEVDEDQVFRVTARSTMRPEKIQRVWEYTRLKRYYEISNEVRHGNA